jgi:hypothetical protein
MLDTDGEMGGAVRRRFERLTFRHGRFCGEVVDNMIGLLSEEAAESSDDPAYVILWLAAERKIQLLDLSSDFLCSFH